MLENSGQSEEKGRECHLVWRFRHTWDAGRGLARMNKFEAIKSKCTQAATAAVQKRLSKSMIVVSKWIGVCTEIQLVYRQSQKNKGDQIRDGEAVVETILFALLTHL